MVKTEKQTKYDKLLAKAEGETFGLPLAEGVEFSRLNVTISDSSVISIDKSGTITALKKGIAQNDVSFGEKRNRR